MRKILLGALLILLLSSCVNTQSYVSEFTLSPDLSPEEKLNALGAKKIQVDEPECFFSGSLWLERLMELTRECEDYILITTFLGSSSPLTEEFYSLLCEKAESGIDVYMIIDGISSYDMTESRDFMTPLYFLRESGVHLIEYSPLTFMHIIAPHELIIREHRKMFIFDGRYSAIGGMNINYISIGSAENNQRDSMYLFSSSSLASALTDEFVNIWNEMSIEPLERDLFQSYENEGSESIDAYLFNQGPGGNAFISDLYATLINSAEKEIDFIAFLPLLDENMKASLRLAKDRGVHIKTIISTEPRSYGGVAYKLPELVELVDEAYLSYDNDLPLLHEKLMVVDDKYTVIGSVNFNYRSMGLSNEIALMIDDEDFAAKEKAHLNERAGENAVKIDLSDAERIKKEGGSFFTFLFNYFGG